MSDENQPDSTSFNRSYKVLKDTADRLSQQREPDIDQLVPKVERAMKAYSICKDRLGKVQETLAQYFDKDESEGSAAPGPTAGTMNRVMPTEETTDGEAEGDIPF
jgi:exodeoxyribonuclease VII small subunit